MSHRITNSTHHADGATIGVGVIVAIFGAVALTALCFGIGAIVARAIWG